MIRICYCVDAPFLGGAEYYVSRLATSLDRSRFDISILMAKAADGGALDAWAADLAAGGIAVERMPMRLPWRLDDAPRLWRSLEKLAPHVVHVNLPGPYSGQNALLAPIARAAGARVVTTEHLPMVAPLWKRQMVKRLAVGSVDVAVTMTQANASFLVERQGVRPERVRVVANGVPVAYGRRAGTRPSKPTGVVIFVGNIIPHKGLHATIEALSSLPSNWCLHVVGTGPDEPRCRGLAARLGLESRVVFYGRQTPGEVENRLADADILVLPSEMEGLPYVILEAMASSLPVVATEVYGIPEAVVHGETGWLVAPGDTAALSAALRRLVDVPALRHEWGAAARRRFEQHFTLERQVRVMSVIYERLAKGMDAPR